MLDWVYFDALRKLKAQDAALPEQESPAKLNQIYLKKCQQYLSLLLKEFEECIELQRDTAPVLAHLALTAGLIETLYARDKKPSERNANAVTFLEKNAADVIKTSAESPSVEPSSPKDARCFKDTSTRVTTLKTAKDVLSTPLPSSGLSFKETVALILLSIPTLGAVFGGYKLYCSYRDGKGERLAEAVSEGNQCRPNR